MGLFKIFKESIEDAQKQLKESIEGAQKQFMENLDDAKNQVLGRQKDIFGLQKGSSERPNVESEQKDNTSKSRFISQEQEEEEPTRKIGTLENGTLELFEGIITLDSDSLDGYNNLRKIIMPASLEKVDGEFIYSLEDLEEVDFSKVNRLKEIPESFISGNHNIHKFVIPCGVNVVGRYFLGEPKSGTEIYIPDTVNKIGCINGNSDNDLVVYLYAAEIDDVIEMCADVDVLYVLPQYYSAYASKIKDFGLNTRLCQMPADKINFYNKEIPVVNNESPEASQNSDMPKSIPTEEKQEKSEVHSSGMFSDRIEKLIEAALQDGVLTDKEEEILKRRVEKEGEDWDEVEMYIQSILQKRQQELSKEANITQSTKATNDINEEQKRAETLRKCPKCGAYIPHLSNVCPDCGFIIEKNDTDKKISTLISLLRTCTDKAVVDSGFGSSWDIKLSSDLEGVVISKDIYDMLPNCYLLNSDQSGMNATTVRANYNRSGIITEAYMYSENDTINSMLFKLHRKEKDMVVSKIKECINKGHRIYTKMANGGMILLKDYYDIMDNAEIAAIEAEYESRL